tara:strand:- start:477 stop:647 length:171 start_codon:yes stop_codon:yes gene_type:complete
MAASGHMHAILSYAIILMVLTTSSFLPGLHGVVPPNEIQGIILINIHDGNNDDNNE